MFFFIHTYFSSTMAVYNNNNTNPCQLNKLRLTKTLNILQIKAQILHFGRELDIFRKHVMKNKE